MFAAERARAAGTKVFLDLDFRADVWADVRSYGVTIRSVLRLTDVVIGTSEEVTRAAGESESKIDDVAASLLEAGANTLIVKRGSESTFVFPRGDAKIEAATFPVDVLNVLGAGDAFACGLIYGYLQDWDWYRAARMGNACGAMVVTRHGCANFMPYDGALNLSGEGILSGSFERKSSSESVLAQIRDTVNDRTSLVARAESACATTKRQVEHTGFDHPAGAVRASATIR